MNIQEFINRIIALTVFTLIVYVLIVFGVVFVKHWMKRKSGMSNKKPGSNLPQSKPPQHSARKRSVPRGL
jgi:heme/copper-type cytochrome/quinol oxidase subunit 2